jgi:hypothetical protein
MLDKRGRRVPRIARLAADSLGFMPSQVVVPHRPGPLMEVPEHAEPRSGIGATEIVLSAGGAALLAAVLTAGWPAWLSVVAIACLALGLALPAHAALLRVKHRRPEGMPLDVSDAAVRRLLAAYRRLERTAGPGPARDAGHLAVTEVATLLNGRPPGNQEAAYVARRAEAVSALADRLADRRLSEGPPMEVADSDSIARIEALLGR